MSRLQANWLARCALAAALVAGASGVPAQPLFHEHGHGLAFGPDGSTLFAPSHQGLAAYHDGRWEPAPGVARAFSGFSATEKAIYSSGHALPEPLASPPAGLLRSTDGGSTWTAIALAGEADFHLLAASRKSGAIYVLNGRPNSSMPAIGPHLTTSEGRVWRHAAARGLEGEVHGLAAHPLDWRIVAAGTARGLYVSRDAGRTFERRDGREPVTALAFTADGAQVRYATALSTALMEAGLDGRPRRLARLPRLRNDYPTSLEQHPAEDATLAFASHRRSAYLTRDGGRTWTRIADNGEARSNGVDGAR